MLHHFTRSIAHIALPDKFTYPFHYTPHPLCVMAADEVQVYLQHQAQWQDELQQGKMFGVLIVQTTEGEIGYLAAFSGILAGKNIHPYFVPPIYDLLQPDGFFKKEEEHISAINHRIRELEEDTSYQKCRQALEEETARCSQLLSQAKARLKAAKELRDRRRQTEQLSESEQAAMIRESQFQKAELKRLERSLKEHLSSLQKETDTYVSQIEALKNERKSRSATLQQQLFEQFRLLNARGEVKDLCSIFAHTVHKIPPAGAGECAAPKLLQYAYFHHYRPVAMAEFWWGDSPKAEIRHHGHYYPACKGKCEPILGHMLQGLEVEENPLLEDNHRTTVLDIIYEDDYLLIVNKPADMLSVPGKETVDSVYSRIRHLYPDATGPLVVHRLDMATSGLLLIAKTKEVHQNLQAQFSNRSIKKRYTALLEGIVSDEEGTIDLPLCLNPLDRPRQIVDKEHGKPAITRYRVLARTESQTLVAFYPLIRHIPSDYTALSKATNSTAARPTDFTCTQSLWSLPILSARKK